MVISSTSTVDDSIQAVSPLLTVGSAARQAQLRRLGERDADANMQNAMPSRAPSARQVPRG